MAAVTVLPLLAFLAAGLLAVLPAHATGPLNSQIWVSCSEAVAEAERRAGIPRLLLQSIALAESGRWDAAQGATVAWPWTMNAEGRGQFFPSRSAAIATVKGLRRGGMESIDVGCMQINLRHHPDAFGSIEEAFDPRANAEYAARFLRDLYEETGSWSAAVGRYHSATPQYAVPYRARVLDLWDEQKDLARNGRLPDDSVDIGGLAPPRRGGTTAPKAYSLRPPSVPIDHERTASLNAAFAERRPTADSARTTEEDGARQPGSSSGTTLFGRPIRSAAPPRISTTATRSAADAASFAENRRRQLETWRNGNGYFAGRSPG